MAPPCTGHRAVGAEVLGAFGRVVLERDVQDRKGGWGQRATNALWSARAPNNMAWFTASPPSADAAANPMSPTANTRLRPL